MSYVGNEQRDQSSAGVHRVTMNMWRWRVWFEDRDKPVEVVTEQRTELHAIATAIDMLHSTHKQRMRVLRVQLVDDED